MNKLSNKQLVLIGCGLIVLSIILFMLSSCGKKEEKNNTASKYKQYDESSYKEKSRDYYEAQAKALKLHINYIFVDDRHEMAINELDSESLINLLNMLLSGSSDSLCYEESYLKQKLNEYFDINSYTFDRNGSNYYFENGKICFSEPLLYEGQDIKVTSYKESNDSIIIIVNYDNINWQYTYLKQENKTYLYSVYKD